MIDQASNETAYFNHLYSMLDDETYKAIKSSLFLQEEFCNLKEKTHSKTTYSWTGIYLTGKNTYLEFFNLENEKALHKSGIKNTGLCFSVDRLEHLNRLSLNWSKPNLFEKKVEKSVIPWFKYRSPKTNFDNENFITWIMAYHPDYISHCTNTKAKDQESRKFYNEACNAVSYQKEKLFKDVVEITFSSPLCTIEKLSKLLIELGFKINQ